jgi:hypothetical protein
MNSTALAEQDLISMHEEMNAKGWRCRYAMDRWELYTPPDMVARFKLTANHQLGTYRSLLEAYAAFKAIVFFDWISQLKRVET